MQSSAATQVGSNSLLLSIVAKWSDQSTLCALAAVARLTRTLVISEIARRTHDQIGRVESFEHLPEGVRKGRRELWRAFCEFHNAAVVPSDELNVQGYIDGQSSCCATELSWIGMCSSSDCCLCRFPRGGEVLFRASCCASKDLDSCALDFKLVPARPHSLARQPRQRLRPLIHQSQQPERTTLVCCQPRQPGSSGDPHPPAPQPTRPDRPFSGCLLQDPGQLATGRR